MCPVVLVVRLEFADVGLPAEVVLVDEGNGEVIFVGGHVRQVSIESLGGQHVAAAE